MKEKILFIINPVSGKKPKDYLPNLITGNFNSDHYITEIYFTKHRGDANQKVKDYLKKGFKKFVAVGGDGTVNEVASELTQTDGVLGIVPIGSGNGLARHLKIPMNNQKAIDNLKNGKVRKIDFGLINNKKFFCTTGVGFDAHIGSIFSKMEGRGFSNYIKATISEFFRYKAKDYEILLDGQKIHRNAFLITFANATQYGNNAHIAPKAKVDDGVLEVSIMRPFSLIAAPVIGMRLFLKNIHKSRYLENFQCTNITVNRNEPDVIHYDGEPGEMDESLNVKIIPEGLNVILP